MTDIKLLGVYFKEGCHSSYWVQCVLSAKFCWHRMNDELLDPTFLWFRYADVLVLYYMTQFYIHTSIAFGPSRKLFSFSHPQQ
jgi:hypothetical protein